MSSTTQEEKRSEIEACLGHTCPARTEYLKEALKSDFLEKQLSIVEKENAEYRKAMRELFGVIGNYFQFLAGTIQQKIDNKQSLTFHDIRQIKEVVFRFPDSPITNDIMNMLDVYMTNTRKESSLDILLELHRYDCCVTKAENPQSSKQNQFKEKLRAIILFEYKRLLRAESAKFIAGKIKYSEYRLLVNKYTDLSGELYPK